MMSVRRLFVLTGVLAGLFASGGAHAEEGPPDWYAVQVRLAERLESEDVGAVARDLAAAEGTSQEARLARLVAFVRADHEAQARAAVEALSDVPRETLASVCLWLIDRQRDALARRLLEVRPDVPTGWTYVLLRRMVESEGLAATLDWVREREKDEPVVWLRERAELLHLYGGVAELLDELESSVRAEPGDVDAILRYLSLVSRFDTDDREVAWVADVAQTSGPVQDITLGHALMSPAPRAALRIVRRSLERELGEADRAALLQRRQQRALEVRQERDLDALFRFEARRVLLDALLAAGETQEAQELMEQLTREMEDGAGGSLLAPGWLERAGEVQDASGHRVIEEKVREEEALGAEDPQYWMRRSAYFRGRKEWAEALTAARRAVELTPLDGNLWHRRQAVDAVEWLIREIHGEEAAYSYLREELAGVEAHDGFAAHPSRKPSKAAPEGRLNELAHGIVRDLAFDYPRLVAAEDELLWRYLASVPALDHTTERLFRQMAENGEADDPFWERIVEIVRAGEPRGRECLGFVMVVAGHPARAIPFLRESLDVVPAGEHRERCGFLIVRAGLEAEDWRAAEQAWPLGRRRLGPDDRPERLARMALLAAQDGELDAALGLWQRKANYDRGDLRAVTELAQVPGMAERLGKWYEQLAEQDPACGARDRFVKALKQR